MNQTLFTAPFEISEQTIKNFKPNTHSSKKAIQQVKFAQKIENFTRKNLQGPVRLNFRNDLLRGHTLRDIGQYISTPRNLRNQIQGGPQNDNPFMRLNRQQLNLEETTDFNDLLINFLQYFQTFRFDYIHFISAIPVIFKSEIGKNTPPLIKLCQFWHEQTLNNDVYGQYRQDELIQHENFVTHEVQDLFGSYINYNRILDDNRSVYDLDNFFNLYIHKLTDKDEDEQLCNYARKFSFRSDDYVIVFQPKTSSDVNQSFAGFFPSRHMSHHQVYKNLKLSFARIVQFGAFFYRSIYEENVIVNLNAGRLVNTDYNPMNVANPDYIEPTFQITNSVLKDFKGRHVAYLKNCRNSIIMAQYRKYPYMTRQITVEQLESLTHQYVTKDAQDMDHESDRQYIVRFREHVAQNRQTAIDYMVYNQNRYLQSEIKHPLENQYSPMTIYNKVEDNISDVQEFTNLNNFHYWVRRTNPNLQQQQPNEEDIQFQRRIADKESQLSIEDYMTFNNAGSNELMNPTTHFKRIYGQNNELELKRAYKNWCSRQPAFPYFLISPQNDPLTKFINTFSDFETLVEASNLWDQIVPLNPLSKEKNKLLQFIDKRLEFEWFTALLWKLVKQISLKDSCTVAQLRQVQAALKTYYINQLRLTQVQQLVDLLLQFKVTQKQYKRNPNITTFYKYLKASETYYDELKRLFINPSSLFVFFQISYEDQQIAKQLDDEEYKFLSDGFDIAYESRQQSCYNRLIMQMVIGNKLPQIKFYTSMANENVSMNSIHEGNNLRYKRIKLTNNLTKQIKKSRNLMYEGLVPISSKCQAVILSESFKRFNISGKYKSIGIRRTSLMHKKRLILRQLNRSVRRIGNPRRRTNVDLALYNTGIQILREINRRLDNH